MLRINLIPAYIGERRKTRAAIVISSILFILPVLGLLAFWMNLQKQVQDMEAQATQAEADKAAVDKINQEASSTRAKIAPLKDKVDFVDNVRFYNTLPERIYRQAARYTVREVEYNRMTVSGNTLSVAGFVSGSPENTGAAAVRNFGRYMISFFGNPDITALSVAGLPGYPSPEAGTATAQNNGSGGPAGMGIPGGFGPMGGRGPMMSAGGPGMGAAGMGAAGMGGGNPGGTETGPNGEQLPPRPGFPFTATATLKRAIAAPSLPASLGGGTAEGGAGMPAPGMPPAAEGMAPGP